MTMIHTTPIGEGHPAKGPDGPIVLDTEQQHYLREAIAARSEYFHSLELDNSETAHLTLALAWFRAYWEDRLTRRARHDHSP